MAGGSSPSARSPGPGRWQRPRVRRRAATVAAPGHRWSASFQTILARAPLPPFDIHDVDRPGQALEGRASPIRRPVRLAHRREAADDVAAAAERRDPRSLVDAAAVEVTAHPGRVRGVEPDPD